MFENYKKLLSEFIAIMSISTDSAHQSDVNNAAKFLTKLLTDNGFTVTVLKGDNSNPVVVARVDIGAVETVLVYGHYDVQPAVIDQGWDSNPFALDERDGRLYGRGVVDDKGQVLIHIVTAIDLLKQNKLAKNIVFVIEGNEETGNDDLPKLLSDNKELFACDYVVISDGEIVGTTPTLEASLRGGFGVHIDLQTGQNDLHSGIAGGAVPSASFEITKLLADLFDETGKVAIPGFYDAALPVPEEVARANHLLAESENLPEKLGVKQLKSVNETDFYTQTGLYPTLQITGIKSGYIGEGFANIVPATAEAKLNVRLVADQDGQVIWESLKEHISAAVPDYVTLKLEVKDIHNPTQIDLTSVPAQAVTMLLQDVYGKKPIITNAGGAIPIVSDFQEILKVPTLLVNLGNDDCNMHGANENFRIDLAEKGLGFSRRFFSTR